MDDCICYVGPQYGTYQPYAQNFFRGSSGNDCIAITEFYGDPDEEFFVYGADGDDIIIAPNANKVYGGDGDDTCRGGEAHLDCE